MTFYDLFIEPFQNFEFMKRALVGAMTLSLGSAPVGVLLVLRRMSLMGDALSHAILPGVAIGFLIAGFSLFAMTIGGLIAGCILALLAGIVSKRTNLKEDATFAGFFILSLALGVMLISTRGNNVNLTHVLFGNILALDQESLLLIGTVTITTLILLALIYRPLIIECFDATFLKLTTTKSELYHLLFLVMVVMNLVAAFQSLGTLMALGLMMLPAISAKLWAREITKMFLVSLLCAISSGYIGLVLSYHLNLPTGPTVILVAGGIYLFSLLFGQEGGLFKLKAYK